MKLSELAPFSAVLIGLTGLLSAAGVAPAYAASVNDGGLQLVRSYTGNLSWSIDGLGSNSGTGTLQIEKPAGGSVVAAFLMVAANLFTGDVGSADLADFRLDGSVPSFTDDASDTVTRFRNFFADVTTIVAPTVNAAPAGVVSVAVDEGAFAANVDGSALVVIFQDPAISVSSVALFFGTSNTIDSQFELAFSALTAPQTQDVRLSVGSAYSAFAAQNTVITVNGQTLTEQAGNFDDCDEYVPGDEDFLNWTCADGSLVTAGGVGDSLTNPVIGLPWTTTSDDELYSLTPFVAVGDTAITVDTSNASNDDNLFFAAFYLEAVALPGAIPIGRASGPTLPATGPSGLAPIGGAAGVVLVVGLVSLGVSRRRASASITRV